MTMSMNEKDTAVHVILSLPFDHAEKNKILSAICKQFRFDLLKLPTPEISVVFWDNSNVTLQTDKYCHRFESAVYAAFHYWQVCQSNGNILVSIHNPDDMVNLNRYTIIPDYRVSTGNDVSIYLNTGRIPKAANIAESCFYAALGCTG